MPVQFKGGFTLHCNSCEYTFLACENRNGQLGYVVHCTHLHKGAAANAASKDLPTGVLQHVAAQRFPRGEHLLADSAAVLSFAQVSVFVLLQVTLLEELLCASQSQPVVTR